MTTDIQKIKKTINELKRPKGVIRFFENCEAVKMLTLCGDAVGFDIVNNGYHYIYYFTGKHKINVQISDNDIEQFNFEEDMYFYKFLKMIKDKTKNQKAR